MSETMAPTSLRGAVECTLRGEDHVLRFTQGSFLWMEEQFGITFDEIREILQQATIPWKLMAKFVAGGLLHEDPKMTEERAKFMIEDSLPADLQTDLFSALIFALNGAEEKKVETLERAMKLLSPGGTQTTGTAPSDSDSTLG